MQSKKKIYHLDCTLRDGGYYNSWNFSDELVQDYINCMSKSKVDVVEIGFRFLNNTNFLGPTAFSKENYINNFHIPKNLKIAVMLNGSDLIGSKDNINKKINNFFVKKKQSKIEIVRVACHFTEVEKVLENIIKLKRLGYKVAINLMQISEESEFNIIKCIKKIKKIKPEVIYFADSVGSLNPEKTDAIVRAIRSVWEGDIGIHTHDNLSLALINTSAAIKSGVNWVDTTVTGMGRGPGNTKTEYFLAERAKKDKNIKLNYIIKLISKYFQVLQKQYGWGTNTFYYLAGTNGIHPTYIQEMLKENRYDDNQKLFIIDNLKKINSRFYNKDYLENNKEFFSIKNIDLKWSPKKNLFNKDILILGNGLSIKENVNYIEKIIKEKKLTVLSTNIEKNISEKYINYRLACNPYRIISDINKYKKNKKPIIMPTKILNHGIKMSKNKILNYDLILGNNFKFNNNFCKLTKPLALFYAVALANSSKVKSIYIAGFDGANDPDTLVNEINIFLEKYYNNKKHIKIFSFTPSKYKLKVIPLFKEL